MNAKAFSLSNHFRIDFGTAQKFGQGAKECEEPPDFDAYQTKSLAHLSQNLMKVKWEVLGSYKR